MTHNITKEQYLNDPCGSCSTAFWKNSCFPVPDGISIVHERDFVRAGDNTKTGERESDTTGHILGTYFKLFHDLKNINLPQIDERYVFQNADIENDVDLVANVISRCYDMKLSPQTVREWQSSRVFDSDLWVFIVDVDKGVPAALGIADFDPEVGEGSLEWIQVLPEYRNEGLGAAVVNELLHRLKTKADFVTVSGQTDNKTKPEALYRKCGFEGNDVWHVVRTKA